MENADFPLSASAVQESAVEEIDTFAAFFLVEYTFTTVFTTALWLRVSHIFWVLFSSVESLP